ncbi:hypothetical protein [Lentibacillus sediminis]|nr:hypothetical protein [Lentibacillus sediminis]
MFITMASAKYVPHLHNLAEIGLAEEAHFFPPSAHWIAELE